MKTAILLAAYGAGTSPGREGLRMFEELCKDRFPGYPMRWAYTSIRLRERIAKERQKSDSVTKALMRLYYERHEAVAIQPLQAICGREYEEVARSAESVQIETGMRIAIGRPLLDEGDSFENVAKALLCALPEERKSGESIIFMGHGARHPAVCLYDRLAEALSALDGNIFLGTLRGKRQLDSLLPQLASRRVWLLPLLSLVGGHALKDMAGDDADSWKSRISLDGHECIPVLKGLAQTEQVSGIWLDKLASAISLLGG